MGKSKKKEKGVTKTLVHLFDIDGVLVDNTDLDDWMLGIRTDYDLYHEIVRHRQPLDNEATKQLDRVDIHGGPLIFYTGRSERYRDLTMEWLEEIFNIARMSDVSLWMRPDDADGLSAAQLKLNLVAAISVTHPEYYKYIVWEDDPSVVNALFKWESFAEKIHEVHFLPGFPAAPPEEINQKERITKLVLERLQDVYWDKLIDVQWDSLQQAAAIAAEEIYQELRA